jgi:beta-lactamase superfamily II metal-dependent hydrolase
MRLTVHDVGLGQCISLVHPSGFNMLWDAGTRDNFTPTQFYREIGISEINRFFITNFDQDHVTGLAELKSKVSLRLLHRNWKVPAEYLRDLKERSGPISESMEVALTMHETWKGTASPESLVLPPDISFKTFCNAPSQEIQDTNNLSLVTILVAGGVKFVISGDLEFIGWDVLIRETNILDELSGTDVFVASHHGRQNGYHETVMEAASPSCVVMSDYEVKHATQQSLDLYRRHCSGMTLNGETRRILTTRRDGSFWWDL